MHWPTVLVGLFCTGFGAYTGYLRVSDPSKLAKLAAMKEQFGVSAGNRIHLFGYTVVPILFGALCLVIGFQGQAILAP